jgi:hypothetical protein
MWKCAHCGTMMFEDEKECVGCPALDDEWAEEDDEED